MGWLRQQGGEKTEPEPEPEREPEREPEPVQELLDVEVVGHVRAPPSEEQRCVTPGPVAVCFEN